MKEGAAKLSNTADEMPSTVDDGLLESITGGKQPEYLTREEATEIVRRNVEWNEQRGCTTDPKSQQIMLEQWMAKPINRAELEKKGGISYFFPK
ncbi:hypothetical protein [Noviherbaspirillum pedocola]|uniref:Uncharacterized protein n=1 Tax=Noviherbaspirillum pedocola TaxID=2801341 RepID=A0A934SY79_9BURK|nr:hypothetical protein [Noviherbaspirillum pedocola]MBK4734879.1 hypothetical protein [Noviherbaspirillum pedocola]